MSINLSVPAILNKISILPQQAFTAVVLAGILSFGGSVIWQQAASAAPINSNQPQTTLSQSKLNQKEQLNPRIFNAIRRDLSSQLRIAPGKIKLVSYAQETWPNGCLGLSRPDVMCTQALVPGWRVVVSNGKQNWVYRTDASGANVVLER